MRHYKGRVRIYLNSRLDFAERHPTTKINSKIRTLLISKSQILGGICRMLIDVWPEVRGIITAKGVLIRAGTG